MAARRSDHYWSTQSDSGHRGVGDYYAAKAAEHSAFMRSEDRTEIVADFGCGAGELLEALVQDLHVGYAIEPSPSMLAEAKSRLEGCQGLEFINKSGHEAAGMVPDARVWMTCGAMNQYLPAKGLVEWLRAFVDSKSTRSVYLFDTIDPARYAYLQVRSQMSPRRRSVRSSVRRFGRGFALQAANVGRRNDWSLLKASMGYGYFPPYFASLAEEHGLSVRYASSAFYEYRYHVALHKQ